MTPYSDVTILAGKREFKLHRALLWARSLWFRALLAERWKKGSTSNVVEVSAMPADVFSIVIEFLYTGYGIPFVR